MAGLTAKDISEPASQKAARSRAAMYMLEMMFSFDLVLRPLA